jgi:hypothetical protein
MFFWRLALRPRHARSLKEDHRVGILSGQESLDGIVEPVSSQVMALGHGSCGAVYNLLGFKHGVEVTCGAARVIGERHCGTTDKEQLGTLTVGVQNCSEFRQ